MSRQQYSRIIFTAVVFVMLTGCDRDNSHYQGMKKQQHSDYYRDTNSGSLPYQDRALIQSNSFVQDSMIVDLPEEAIDVARTVVASEVNDNLTHPLRYIYDFYTPFELSGFTEKAGHVYVIEVGGYKSKDLKPTNKYLWINQNGAHYWVP